MNIIIGVGAQKSGTSTLAKILSKHRNVFVPSCKEVHFFDKKERYKKGVKWYKKSISSNSKDVLYGADVTPIYMYHDKVPARIVNTLGRQVKIVFLLRDPVERAYSHYWMNVRRGDETLSFEEAISCEDERLKKCPMYRRKYSYIDRGFYDEQISRFLRLFDRDNIIFFRFGEFVNNQKKSGERLYDFLGLEFDHTSVGQVHENRSSMFRSELAHKFLSRRAPSLIKWIGKTVIPITSWRRGVINWLRCLNEKQFTKPPMGTVLRCNLRSEFSNSIRRTESLTGMDLSSWKP